MIDETGKKVWEETFDLWGKPHDRLETRVVGGAILTNVKPREANKNQGISQPFRFPGQYYNRYRYYMPNEGMYTQRDPIGLSGGNPTVYGYVFDTLKEVDPFGLIAQLYYLVAEKDGFYDVLNYNAPTTKKGVYLREGEIWKIGETKRFSSTGEQLRYSKKWLTNNNLKYKPVMESPNSSAKKSFQKIETQKIDKYKKRRGKLPAGNRCRS